jgi:rhodanese-related sulfurtransferase
MEITDETIIQHIGELMVRLKKDKELQTLAREKGIDIKNTVELTEDSIENYVISVVSLMLAKRSNDPNYKVLCSLGLQKRETKAQLINTYKDQAHQLINAWKMKYMNNQPTSTLA